MNKDLFHEEPGWTGLFTRNQDNGAIPNGTRIKKVNSEPGDANRDGARGTVLGSLRAPDVMGGLRFYFIEWDAKPRVAIGCMATKVEAL